MNKIKKNGAENLKVIHTFNFEGLVISRIGERSLNLQTDFSYDHKIKDGDGFIDAYSNTGKFIIEKFKESGLLSQAEYIEKPVLIKDDRGKEIKSGDIFTFDFSSGTEKENFEGVFVWSDDELRYEIDVLNNGRCTCLSYNPAKMSNFKKK